ncbi:hypothetical protein [Paraburkholderia ferrariae]|uniref:hypothetical protein n=1 Tax=Paraburkholderia ferrariae TaxID=386056 RepID=UPI000489B58C|nr:hypothetical protein [Paraburkholderia ferrariae]
MFQQPFRFVKTLKVISGIFLAIGCVFLLGARKNAMAWLLGPIFLGIGAATTFWAAVLERHQRRKDAEKLAEFRAPED